MCAHLLRQLCFGVCYCKHGVTPLFIRNCGIDSLVCSLHGWSKENNASVCMQLHCGELGRSHATQLLDTCTSKPCQARSAKNLQQCFTSAAWQCCILPPILIAHDHCNLNRKIQSKPDCSLWLNDLLGSNLGRIERQTIFLTARQTNRTNPFRDNTGKHTAKYADAQADMEI